MRNSYISMCADRRVKLLAVLTGLMLAVTDALYIAGMIGSPDKLSYIITAGIVNAFIVWYISGLVRLIRGNTEGGIETIRKYVKTLFVLTVVISALILAMSVLFFVLSFNIDPSRITVRSNININAPDALRLFRIAPLIEFAVCALVFVMMRGINNSIRFVSDVIKGNTPGRKPGRAPEIIMLICVILVCVVVVINTANMVFARSNMIIKSVTFSLAQLVVMAANTYIHYTIFRDIRKIAENN